MLLLNRDDINTEEFKMNEHEKTLSFVYCMIVKYIRHLDWIRAAYWIGVGNALGHVIPCDISDPIIGASYHTPDAKQMLNAINTWVIE